MPINSTKKLAAAFRAAASDGVITRTEVGSALGVAAKNALTRAETRTLANQLGVHADHFEAPAAKQLQRFVAAAKKPADTADPKVMGHDAGALRYREAQGGLYKNGISTRDVVQGHAGDCYLLATLGAAAKQRPALISNAIIKKDDGSFLVRFYGRGADGQPVPVYVPVDKELPRDRWGNSHYAHSAARGESWVAVVEKAYAKWKGSYGAIGNGGNPAEVMAALTGKMGAWSETGAGTAEATFEKMRAHLASKGLVVASTRQGPQYKGSGVAPLHAYTVLGVEDKGGTLYVTLRNPWGKTEPGAPRAGDGVFQLPWSKFAALFPDLFLSA